MPVDLILFNASTPTGIGIVLYIWHWLAGRPKEKGPFYFPYQLHA